MFILRPHLDEKVSSLVKEKLINTVCLLWETSQKIMFIPRPHLDEKVSSLVKEKLINIVCLLWETSQVFSNTRKNLLISPCQRKLAFIQSEI